MNNVFTHGTDFNWIGRSFNQFDRPKRFIRFNGSFRIRIPNVQHMMACQTTGNKTTTELHARKRTAGTQKWISCKGVSFSNAGQTGYHFSGSNCSVLSFLWGVTIDQFRVIQATMAKGPLHSFSASFPSFRY